MDSGELAWAITATALVLFMTPGVAFFYGGLVKAKSVVSMMMMSNIWPPGDRFGGAIAAAHAPLHPKHFIGR